MSVSRDVLYVYVRASICVTVKYIDTFQNAVLNVWCSTCSEQAARRVGMARET
jgi:hypothetical protein